MDRAPEPVQSATLVEGIEEGFASPHCAREELRAEIGHDPSRHAAYLGSWIHALRDDPREIHRAAQDAQVVSDYVLDRAREKAPDRQSGAAAGRERSALQPVRPAPEKSGYRRHLHRELAGPRR